MYSQILLVKVLEPQKVSSVRNASEKNFATVFIKSFTALKR